MIASRIRKSNAAEPHLTVHKCSEIAYTSSCIAMDFMQHSGECLESVW